VVEKTDGLGTVKRLFALGWLSFAFGLGLLVDGAVLPGAGLLALGVLVGVYPAVSIVGQARAVHPDQFGPRSPAASDSVLGRRFRRCGIAVMLISAFPLLAAGAVFVGAYFSVASEGMSAGGRAAALTLIALFAGIPALLAWQLILGGAGLIGGRPDGATVAVWSNWFVTAIGVLVAWSMIGNQPTSAWRGIAAVAIAAAVSGLVVNVLLKKLLRDVDAFGPRTRPGRVLDATKSSSGWSAGAGPASSRATGPASPPPPFEGVSVSEVFDHFFAGPPGTDAGRSPQPGRGSDLTVRLPVDATEVVSGTTKQVKVTTTVTCQPCGGTGSAPGAAGTPCARCAGHGTVHKTTESRSMVLQTDQPCPDCGGSGSHVAEPCRPCAGEGRINGERTIRFRIPDGTRAGTRVRLAGQGAAGRRGAPAGDLYVELQIER